MIRLLIDVASSLIAGTGSANTQQNADSRPVVTDRCIASRRIRAKVTVGFWCS